MELVNALDGIEAGGRIAMPAVAAALALVSGMFAVRAIIAREESDRAE